MRQAANSRSHTTADTQQAEVRIFSNIFFLPCAPCQALAAAYLTKISLDVQVYRLDNAALFDQTEVFKPVSDKKKRSCTGREMYPKMLPLLSDSAFSPFLISTNRSFFAAMQTQTETHASAQSQTFSSRSGLTRSVASCLILSESLV